MGLATFLKHPSWNNFRVYCKTQGAIFLILVGMLTSIMLLSVLFMLAMIIFAAGYVFVNVVDFSELNRIMHTVTNTFLMGTIILCGGYALILIFRLLGQWSVGQMDTLIQKRKGLL